MPTRTFATGNWTTTWTSTTETYYNIVTTNTTMTLGNWPLNYQIIEPPPDRRRQPVIATEEQNRRAEERRRESARARDRARETLMSLLPAEEQERYRDLERIYVQGSAGGEYVIKPGYAGNVERVLTDDLGATRRQRLCAHPPMSDGRHELPTEDAMTAQLLMIRFDEPSFLAIANVTELNDREVVALAA